MSMTTLTRQDVDLGTSRAACWLAAGPLLPAEVAAGLLDDEERRRADAFTSADARDRFVTAHAVLRTVLGEVTGLEPSALRMIRARCPRCGEPHGRPRVAGRGGPEFSLSYSGSVVLVAVSEDSVGVDVERLPDVATADAVARLLDPREARDLADHEDPDDRRLRFARLWVMKEAYLKGTGAGIAGGIAEPYLGTGAGQPRVGGWRLAQLDAPVGYAAAVAVRAVGAGDGKE